MGGSPSVPPPSLRYREAAHVAVLGQHWAALLAAARGFVALWGLGGGVLRIFSVQQGALCPRGAEPRGGCILSFPFGSLLGAAPLPGGGDGPWAECGRGGWVVGGWMGAQLPAVPRGGESSAQSRASLRAHTWPRRRAPAPLSACVRKPPPWPRGKAERGGPVNWPFEAASPPAKSQLRADGLTKRRL